MNDTALIKLKDSYGENLTSRVIGIRVREKAQEILINEQPVIFDFSGVKTISTGFSYEIFHYFYQEYKERFNSIIKIKLDSDNEILIKNIIIRSLE